MSVRNCTETEDWRKPDAQVGRRAAQVGGVGEEQVRSDEEPDALLMRRSLSEPSTSVDGSGPRRYRAEAIDIEASARKHGVTDDGMLHALRYHWRAFETDDPAVTMYIGPATDASPLEIGVVDDKEGTAVLHAMPAREKFLTGWWSR